MTDSQMNPVVVFRTGQVWQMDMAVNALKEARLAYFSQEENASGLRLAMPVAPTPGPGVCWSLLVPESAVEDAKRVLSELPFEIKTNPDAWDFKPEEAVKKTWRTWIVVWLVFLALMTILAILGALQ